MWGLVGLASAQEPEIQVEVVPTPAEWAVFPEYCRARYSISQYANGTRWEGSVPPAEVQRWERQMGSTFEALHHYCYGLVQASRAAMAGDAGSKDYLYTRAIEEFNFTLRRATSNNDPFAGEIAARIALAYRGRNDLDRAISFADQAIEIAPKLEAGFSVKGVVLRERGDLEEAAQVLRQGIDSIGRESAELNYFLGLTYFDMRQFDLAQQHADKAYSLGYPLPGLRNKLERERRSSRAQ
jgi:tetratricopeptide (TPR) repeat protein